MLPPYVLLPGSAIRVGTLMNIYVGNIPCSANEEDLGKAFGGYGVVRSVEIIRRPDSGRSRGFAFVEMPSEEEARAAIQGLEGIEFQGRRLVINEACPR